MYLKRFETQGFKSFADKINLEFSSGITAIVGPNGSGKSNISDAIRWVMGEQKARLLRGAKMEDVIFSGTQTRKAQGYAEVTLTLDNSEGDLPLDYSEVSITRRTYRSGEGEYLINKSPCRLKDVHELLMDTGLGRDGYSIIGQGQIAEILSARPEDRRQVFEEAAGISKYRYRKEESERDLASARENLVRLGDIISEIEERRESLKGQAERAKKYLNLRDELKILEAGLALEVYNKGRQALERVEERIALVRGQEEDTKQKIVEIDAKIEEFYNNSRERDEAAESFRGRREEMEGILARHRTDIEVFRNKVSYAREELERLEGELKLAKKRRDERLEAKNGNNEKLENLVGQEAKFVQDLEELDEKIAEIVHLAQADNYKLETANGEIIGAADEIAVLRERLSALGAEEKSGAARLAAIKGELATKRESLCGKQSAIEELSGCGDLNGERFSKLGGELAALESEFVEITCECEKLEDQVRKLKAKKAEKSMRLKALQDMERDFEGYHRSVKAVLQASDLRGITIYGAVSQLVTAPAGNAVAVEVALSGSAQSVVVKSEEDAKQAIAYLKRKNLGRATFLPVSSVRGSEISTEGLEGEPGFVGLASRLVKSESEFSGIVRYLLGRTIVVDNIDHAVAIARKYGFKHRIVTLEGESLSPGGAMSGGSRGQEGRARGVFARTGEIVSLRREIEGLSGKIKECSDDYMAKKRDKDEKSVKIEEVRMKLHEVECEASEMAGKKVHLSAVLEELRGAVSSLEEERSEWEGGREAIFRERETIESEIRAKQDWAAERNRDYLALKSALGGNNEERERLLSERTRVQIDLSSLKKDAELLRGQNASYSVGIDEYEQEIADKTANIESKVIYIEDFQDEMSFKERQVKEISMALAECCRDEEAAISARREAEEGGKALANPLREFHETLARLRQEAARLEGQKAREEREIEGALGRLWEEYALTVSDAEELVPSKRISISAARSRIQSLCDEIRGLGNINIDAIEEFRTINERYEFLTAQREDIVSGGEQLRQVIDDMSLAMENQFTSQLAVIDREFGEVFVRLFGGGEARLRLVNPQNVLESGIEIEAQPPGKSLQTLQLLSGGEKALVAIAILFAILKVRPTPFCILDEIDAALDGVNVARYINYLRKFSDNTQFILITHKRETMEIADMLYGVTMQEKGVSRMLALRLPEEIMA